MSARRCTTCGISWPLNKQNGNEFRLCPSCQEPTAPMRDTEPDMSLEEARSAAKHFEFERFYADWDASQPPERLLTDFDAVPT